MKYSIQYSKAADTALLGSFYKNTSYRNIDSIKTSDEVILAYSNSTLIGVFRLCNENNICVLRGFNVLPEYQKKGVGTSMLQQFTTMFSQRQCYLICKQSLNTFYVSAGFIPCKNPPAHLINRVQAYNNTQLNILHRNINPSGTYNS